MAGEQVPWPPPPREPGPWNGGPPVAPPGNTPLPPLPGAGGVVFNAPHQTNPWAASGGGPGMGQGPPPVPGPPGVPQPPPFRPNVPPPPGSVPYGGIPPGAPGYGAPPPAAPRSLVDRAPAWLLVASSIVVLALIAGGVFVVTRHGKTYPSSWDPRIVPITDWVQKERGLTYKHPVKVNFLTDKEYTARSTSDNSGPTDKTAQANQVAELRALGFVTGTVDLGAASNALADSGTLAYYDPSVEEVFVRGTKMTAALRVTLAHELTHVLQDQYFDLERLQSLEDGRGEMLRALAEGDATLVEEMYQQDPKVFSEQDRKAYDLETNSASDNAEAGLKDVPPILQTLFSAPYILGPTFVQVLIVAAVGDKASMEMPAGPAKYKEIDKVLADPPSEEVLFDPLTYDTAQAEAQKVSQAAPSGTTKVDDGEFGPTTWYLLLATRLDEKIALKATDGWGGDHFVAFKKAGTVCVDATIHGDTADDASRLADALGSWAAKGPENKASATAKGDTVSFTTCDPGKDARQVGSDASSDLLLLPVRRSQYFAGLWSITGKKAQSACFANKVIDAASVDQLTDQSFLTTGTGQAIRDQAIAACR